MLCTSADMRRRQCRLQFVRLKVGCQLAQRRILRTETNSDIATCRAARQCLQLRVCAKTRWAREPKSKTAHITPFVIFCGVGSCALREIDAICLWRHREHWWHQGHNSPQHAASATSAFFSRYLCLGFRLACFAAWGIQAEAAPLCNDFSVQKLICVKISLGKRLLCVKVSVCTSFSV